MEYTITYFGIRTMTAKLTRGLFPRYSNHWRAVTFSLLGTVFSKATICVLPSSLKAKFHTHTDETYRMNLTNLV
jgi:hypothetical protein